MLSPTPVSISIPSSPPSADEFMADPALLRDAFWSRCDQTNPASLLMVELVIQAFEDFLKLQDAQLGPVRGMAVLDIEAKARRRASQHLRDMLFALHELCPIEKPIVQVHHARQLSDGSPQQHASK
jgi:hypothetical protein